MSAQVTKSIIVKADPQRIFTLWSNFENFPHFMDHVKEVKREDDKKSEWTVSGLLGSSFHWTAEITRMEENKRIGWSTKDRKGSVTTSGQVTFNALPGGQTEVTVVMQYSAPGGKAGKAVASLLANPEKRLEEDLRNFKSLAESMPNKEPS